MTSFKKVSPKARISMIITNLIALLIVGLIVVAVRIFLRQFQLADGINFGINIATVLIVGILLLDLVLQPTIGYMRHKYSIGDQSIEKVTGVFSIQHEIVPIRRMQQIETTEGPINRFLGLASIKIITAGGILKLEYIKKDEANEIADKLKGLINEFAESVGDTNGK